MKAPEPRRLITLLVLLALACSGWWLQRHYEFREYTAPGQPGGEAQRNRWLALQRLLERRGASIRSLPAYDQPPSPGATLLLPQDRRTLSRQQSQALLDWVGAGGRLLVTPITDAGEVQSGDPLLDPLGLRMVPVARLRGGTRAPAEACAAVLPDGSGTLDLVPQFSPTLQPAAAHPPAWQLDDCQGVRLLAWRVGKGTLVVANNYRLFLNPPPGAFGPDGSAILGSGARGAAIGARDHAALAIWLFQPAPGREIWLVRDGGAPSLPALLFAWAPLACLGALGVLLATLWRAALTPGPRLLPAEASGQRRSLTEHLAASGRLLWRLDRGGVLYGMLRTAAIRVLRTRHPAWQDLSGEELVARAASHSGLPPDAVRRALADLRLRDVGEFVRDFRTLETLRKTT